MSEHIKIRVVVEEVVVDFEGNFHTGHYSQGAIDATIRATVEAALKAHAARKVAP